MPTTNPCDIPGNLRLLYQARIEHNLLSNRMHHAYKIEAWRINLFEQATGTVCRGVLHAMLKGNVPFANP